MCDGFFVMVIFLAGMFFGIACEYLRGRLETERREWRRIRNRELTEAFERDFGAAGMTVRRNGDGSVCLPSLSPWLAGDRLRLYVSTWIGAESATEEA